jgi:hypothetical protein
MARVLVAIALSLALAAGVTPKSPSAANGQNTNERDAGHRQARIQFQYEEIRERKWETKSVGQVFHYGQESEVRSMRGMIVLEVPDEDLLRSLEVPGTPINAPAQSPRITIWNYMGPNKLFPQAMDGPKLEVGDRAKIIQCTGSANYRRDYESNDKGLEEHSKTQWRWYKMTRNALGNMPLTLVGSNTNWSIFFNSQDGLDLFRYSVLPIPVTEKEVSDGRISTSESAEEVELLIPLPKESPEKGWTFTRQMSTRSLDASGTLSKILTDGSTVHGSLRVTIDLDPAQYECLITPPDSYRSWIPKGGNNNEEEVGNSLQFKGEIRCVSGDPAPDRQIWVEVRGDSSTQPGVCVNFPAKGKKTADLVIQREGTSEALELKSNAGTGNDDAWSTATGNFKVGQRFTVKVGSRDFGAFGDIHFNSDIPVRIEGFRDPSSLDLPFDNNHNHISDEWEQGSSGLADAGADDDNRPEGNGIDGDGLSVYEEYRGFMCRAVHTRTAPFLKDLFIRDQHGLGSGMLGQSGISIHFISKDEYGKEEGAQNKYVINCNRAYATLGQQHLLGLRKGTVPDGYMGMAQGKGDPGPPRQTSIVIIAAYRCRRAGPGWLEVVVSHELSHGCNVRHHGEGDYQGNYLETRQDDGTWAGSSDPFTALYPHMVAATGAQCSGAENCIMRYPGADWAELYEKVGGKKRWRKEGQGDYIEGESYPAGHVSQTLYCDTKKGAGVAGDASCGDCLHQFQVNDHKTPRTPPCGK